MKYYLDITLLPDADVNLGFLWQKVYQQVHLALVENKTINNSSMVAVSFPNNADKSFPLGNKLRFLATNEVQLQELDITKWLSRLSDYVHISSMKAVPDTVSKFVCFSRKHVKSSNERLARRRAKRHSETLTQALAYYANFEEKSSELPFVHLQSLSKKETFKLFIEKQYVDKAVVGSFNCYGLSKTATVPWF